MIDARHGMVDIWLKLILIFVGCFPLAEETTDCMSESLCVNSIFSIDGFGFQLTDDVPGYG